MFFMKEVDKTREVVENAATRKAKNAAEAAADQRVLYFAKTPRLRQYLPAVAERYIAQGNLRFDSEASTET
jgi:hypothetical protein